MRFEFHQALSGPLKLTLLSPATGKQSRHKHIVYSDQVRVVPSTLAVPNFVLNMAKRPQEVQIYTRRDVFAPPNTNYVNQVFQPEPGRGGVIILRKPPRLAANSY